MPECGGCGAVIDFVTILTKNDRQQPHPIDVPRRRVPEGRVIYDDTIGLWRILDARLKRAKDGITWEIRAGIEWPVDGGAYVSHFDTCPAEYARRVADRTHRARSEEEHAAALLEDANAHIPRCQACGALMDEDLAADDRAGSRRSPWRTHPACDPEHRLTDVAEANRLTGRRDVDARSVAVPAAVLVQAQQEQVRHLAEEERLIRPDWRQGAMDVRGLRA